MNKPEQYQPNNTDERQETADAAPVSSSSDLHSRSMVKSANPNMAR